MTILDWLSGFAHPVLRGDGVLLRLPQASDYSAWRAIREESRGFLTPWEPAWSGDELSRGAFRARVRRYRQDARERSSYTFLLFDSSGAILYGGATLGQIRRGVAQSATLGYWMGERFAGSGLMFRGVETLKTFAFEVEGLHRIEAACLPSNTRSMRLLEKSGFVREGHLRNYLKIAGAWEDHILYSLLVEDWSKARPRALGTHAS